MKHAYMIMAHNNFYTLKTLLKLLDDERNDIYLHINKSVENWDNDEWDSILDHAKIHFVKRVYVHWSTYSQVDAIKNLLMEATKTYHDYYHMLSGSDLPIKSQDHIDLFFSNNSKKEFIGFSKVFKKENVSQKNYCIRYFHNKNNFISLNARRLRKYLILVQKLLGIDITRNIDGEVKKGHDWFSITHDAANLLIEREPEFKKYFYRAFAPTEFFTQTILYNSEFRKNIYNLDDENIGSQRYIDWERGKPYIFRKEDFNLLKKSEMMFARKFMESEDMEIIDNLYNYLKVPNKKKDRDEV